MIFPSYSPTPINDSGEPAVPPVEEDEDAAEPGRAADTAYELAESDWRGIATEHHSEPDLPVRFIDGSIRTRTVGVIRVGQRRRPLIAATVAATALHKDDRSLKRAAGSQVGRYLCLHSNDLDPRELDEARQQLAQFDIRIAESQSRDLNADFDTLRWRTRAVAMGEMEAAEARVLLADQYTPTLVDGLLERRLIDAPTLRLPAVGLVKRQLRHPLRPELQELVYGLAPGERSPAFVLIEPRNEIELVTFYLRLAAQPGSVPSDGVVRIALTREYLERRNGAERWIFLSRLGGYLYRLRQRDVAYSRASISIQPVVQVEDHLKAILPPIQTLIPKLHRLMRQEAP